MIAGPVQVDDQCGRRLRRIDFKSASRNYLQNERLYLYICGKRKETAKGMEFETDYLLRYRYDTCLYRKPHFGISSILELAVVAQPALGSYSPSKPR